MDVEIRVVENQKGKGLFAKKDFKAGDVIFEEDPLVCCQFAWNEQYGYEACDHCMRPLETAEENAKRLTYKWHIVLPWFFRSLLRILRSYFLFNLTDIQLNILQNNT